MIVTLLFIFAFIRTIPWKRERRNANTQLALTNANTSSTSTKNNHTVSNSNNLHTSPVPDATLQVLTDLNQRRRSLKTHEVTFSGSVVGGYSDSEATTTLARRPQHTPQSHSPPTGLRPSSPESISSTSQLYRSLSSSRTRATISSEEYETALVESSRRLLRKKRLFPRADTVATDTALETQFNRNQDYCDVDVDGDGDAEDDSYDRDTEEFYSHIQDAIGTTSGSRSKRSSLFSRSDSSATTTSSSGTFTGKRRSAASIISTSVCSDVIPVDRRRSSTTTEYSVRSMQQRRSSGRVRRYISRMTIAGARRRTTGRY